MTLQEIIKKCDEPGLKIRRKSWDVGYFMVIPITPAGIITNERKDIGDFNRADLLANDWEFYEEEKKTIKECNACLNRRRVKDALYGVPEEDIISFHLDIIITTVHRHLDFCHPCTCEDVK